MRMDDVERILAIIDDSHFTEISLQIGDAHLTARKGSDGAATVGSSGQAGAGGSGSGANPGTSNPGTSTAGAPDGAAAGPAAAAQAGGGSAAPAGTGPTRAVDPGRTDGSDPSAGSDEDGVLVRAPMLGVFYRAPAPGEPPFAAEGQQVEAGDTIGTIEVMKLFNSIAAGTPGTVVRFLAENGELVEYDQPLVLVRPEQP